MPINFGASTSGNNNSNINECVKQIIFATGGDVGQLTELITGAIDGIPVGGEIGGTVGGALDSFAGSASSIASNIETFREGLPLSDVLPSSQLRPPINVTKSATDIVNDLQDRCTQFALDALDQIDPLQRLEQLIDLAQDLCGQLNFTNLRRVIDKIDQAKRDIISETISEITDPLEKAAKLNDMLVDAVNSGAQDAIADIDNAIAGLGYEQLYGYINALDPQEAIGRLQAEIANRTQLGDIAGVQDMLNAVRALEASVTEGIDTAISSVTSELNGLVPSVGELFDLPANVVNAAQDKIDEALTLGNYEEIQNVITAVDSVQNQLLGTLQDLDPATLLAKGTTLLNEALAEADLGRYQRILDQMASNLCSQDQLGSLPSLPNVPQIQLPNFLQ